MSHSFRQFKWIGMGAMALLVVLLVLPGISDRSVSTETETWQRAAEIAPSRLMEQVRTEHLGTEATVDLGRMKIWKIWRSAQSHPLYLIDSRIADAARYPQANLFCGQSGCAFWGYISVNHRYQQVLASYFNPRLPPDIPLFSLTGNLQNGLPMLQVNQLEDDRLWQYTLTFSGKTYDITEANLISETHE